VPNVSRRLLDHVYIDPTQGDLAEVRVWDNVIQLVLRRYPPGLRGRGRSPKGPRTVLTTMAFGGAGGRVPAGP
jgi:hypothetical protein